MSDMELTGAENTTFDYRLTLMRFVPAVTFGLQTAALAGLAISVAGVAMGLSGVFDTSHEAITFTTCCGVTDDSSM